jgi:glycerol-3-phosphate dehydrogenase (NAD(P)+)
MQRIGIIGAGAWGTALGLVALRAGRAAIVWAREKEVADSINAAHENPAFLPGVALDPALAATGDLATAAQSDALLLAVPAQFLRAVTRELARHVAPGLPCAICAKGIERATGALLTEICAETLPAPRLAVVSGPTFAPEVARGLPAAVTIAASDPALGRAFVAALGGRAFRPYVGSDPAGSQIGGAVKNVLAIACGIVEGRGLGENARAALITRGLAEMTRLALAMGGRAETLMGLSGLGDLVLTCTGESSRNFSLGRALGEGAALDAVLGERRSIAEGVDTASAVAALAKRLAVEMPISDAVDAILHRGAAIDEAVAALLARPFRSEAAPAGAD